MSLDGGETHYYDGFLGNCGMGVIYELGSNPEKILREFGTDGGWDFDSEPAIIAFSDNHHRLRGDKLASFIRAKKLGRVVSTGVKRVYNGNSGNHIKAWYWVVDRTRFKSWLAKEKK